MKKIIGIIGIAAVLASSMFAAEVKAKVRLTGSIIDYSEADKYNFGIYKDKDDSTKDLLTVMGTRAKFMTLDTHQAENWNPIFDISVSTDVAGAGFKFYNTSGDWEYKIDAYHVNDGKWNVWFKPFDNFKVTMGNFDICLNQEQIDWANGHTSLGGDGYVFEYAMGDFTFDFIMNTGWGKSWIYAPKTMPDHPDYANRKFYSLMGVNRLSETSVKGAYKSPVGTISASVTYKGTDTVDVVITDGTNKETAAKFKDYFKVAAGWNVGNLFGDNITGFVNAWTTIDTKKITSGWRNYSAYGLTDFTYDSTITGLDKIGAEVYAQMTMDAFKFQIYVPFELNMMPVPDLTDDPLAPPLGLYDLFTNYIVAKATYSMSNGVSPYVYVKLSPWAGGKYKLTAGSINTFISYARPSIQVKPAVTGKFGICEYEVAVDSTITLGGDPTVQAFTFKVPVTLTVDF